LLERIAANYPDWPSVEAFVRKVSALKPQLVILFGSLAKEDFTDASDADVLVCFDKPHDWMEVYRFSDGIAQPLVFSLPQIKAELRAGNPVIREAVRTGLLLLGSKSVWKNLLRLARAVARSRN
jgi:predicted nucleotidyltransferase